MRDDNRCHSLFSVFAHQTFAGIPTRPQACEIYSNWHLRNAAL
jgi:hypothetical protein